MSWSTSNLRDQSAIMFTGIIETTGIVKEVIQGAENRSFRIQASITHELKVDQSLAHNGICLTVEVIEADIYQVTAVPETLAKTNAANWSVGDYINLERAMLLNSRLDGHIVLGHVDTRGSCFKIKELNNSWVYTFSFDKAYAKFIIEKGSITVNGISLTCYEVTEDSFSVSIIPYTWEHTNIKKLQEGNLVNLEFDVLGKYVNRIAHFSQPQ